MPTPLNWQDAAAGLGLATLLAVLVAQLAARLVRVVLAAATGDAGGALAGPITRRPIRMVRAVTFLATLALVSRPTLALFGVDLAYGVPLDRLTEWFFAQGLRVLMILLLAYFAVRVAALGIRQFEEVVKTRAGVNVDRLELFGRVRTISGLARNALNVLIWGAATLMMLQELGMDITPLLTGAGIGGLAIGFGAQNLLRDIISGFFLIIEDQVHVGDVVKVNDVSGAVEKVQLRTLVLRDLSGTVHVVPNGSITTLSNLTKDFSFAVLDVGVAYKENTDDVVAVLRDVGDALRADDAFAPHILEALEILGVDQFGDSAVVIKIRIKTRPLKQWTVGRELRRRIKIAFDARGIEIPFPHLSLYFGEASKPFQTGAPAGDPDA